MPGHGRPRKLDKYGGHIVAAEDRIADRLPELIDIMFSLAKGVTVKDVKANGEVEYNQTPPSLKATEYLINRIMGKPTERHEHTEPDLTRMSDSDLMAMGKEAWGEYVHKITANGKPEGE